MRAHNCSSCSLRWSRTIRLSAPKGSSIKQEIGIEGERPAIEARCCMPPESCHGNFCSNPFRLTSSSVRGDALAAQRPT